MHVVIASNGLTSLLNASLELSRRLQAAGHRVTFVCGEGRAGPITAAGEAVVTLAHDRRFDDAAAADPPPPVGALRSPRGLAGLVRWARRRRALRDRSITVDELADTIAGLDPDLVLIDVEFHTAVLATAGLTAPRALAMTFFSVFRGDDLPPLSSTLAPGTGPAWRLRVRAAWWWVGLGALVQRARRRLGAGGLAASLRPMRLDTVDLADLGPLAARCGVDLGASTDRSQWLRPHLAADLPVLCYNAAEMDLPHLPPPRLRYTGPLVGLDRPEPAFPPGTAERWEATVAARRSAASPRPLVYATLGTVWAADRDLLGRIVAAARLRPHWDLVLGLGGALEPDELGPLPDNVLAVRWAPQLAVLAEADVAISHGGSGTLREAVALGVPVVVYSTGFVDQDGNGVRVAHHRLGVVGDPADSPADVVARIEQALTDAGIADGLARMGEVFRRYDRAGTAVEVVEALAVEHRAGPPGRPDGP